MSMRPWGMEVVPGESCGPSMLGLVSKVESSPFAYLPMTLGSENRRTPTEH